MLFSSSVPTKKEKIIQSLLLEVENRYALQPSQTLISKITTVFEKLPEEALGEWVDMLKSLPSEHPEWQSFVEGLTVHETYFCRERNILAGIKQIILPEIIEKNKQRKEINIWSAACSTGEEAYNLAIITLEALQLFLTKKEGVVAQNFLQTHGWKINIYATDLSKLVIRIAETAIYSDAIMGSFRNAYTEILPYFNVEKTEMDSTGALITSYKVKDYVRQLIKFKQYNLLSSTVPFRDIDLVICRNVLIYFNDINKQKVQQSLDKSVVVSGAMVLGTVDNFYLENYEKKLQDGCLWYKKIGTTGISLSAPSSDNSNDKMKNSLLKPNTSSIIKRNP